MKKIKMFFVFLFAALVFATGCEYLPDINITISSPSSETKEYYDMSGVSFNGASYVYDGEEHSLSIEGTLPEGVSVMYLNNNKVNAGTYEVTAKFTGDTKNYYPIEDMKATLTISKVGINGISFKSGSITYDGNPHSIEISGKLPEGVLVSYSGNEQIDVGSYEVTAYFTDTTGNYFELSPLKATLTINKATYDMSGIKFNSASYTYDGNEKEVVIEGTLPSGVEVLYENNTLTNAGRVEATARFKHNNPNYNDIPSKTATLTILKADIEGISFESKEVIYDGTSFSLKVKGNIPEGVKVTYTNNGHINVGTYEIIASFEDTTGNYNNLPDMKATLTINKATHDMSNISLNSASYTYDGYEKEVLIEGTLPNWINVTYLNNKQVNAGEYKVTAVFTHNNSNYNEIPNMTTTLIINKASIEGISFIGSTLTYDGYNHSIYVNGYLPEGIKVEYSNNNQINAGEYEITAVFYDTTGNYIVPEPMTAILIINKLTIDVSLDDQTFSYDGEYHSLSLNVNIPYGIIVDCSNNSFNKVGEYTVTYSFSDTTGNYNIVESLEATLTIVKDGKYHDVVFNFEDGTKEEIVVADGEIIFDIPNIPHKIGHKGSWGENIYSPINEDTEFTVEYTIAQYVITYYSNGGTLIENTQIVTYGEEFELYESSRTGYTLKDYTYYDYLSGQEMILESGLYLIDSDIDVCINWNANKYKVNYYNGETLLFSDEATYDSPYAYKSSYVNEEGLTLIKVIINGYEYNPGTTISKFNYLYDLDVDTVFYKIDSNYTYSANSITGYKGNETELIIPEYVGSGNIYYKVLSIAENAFINNKEITSVILSRHITSINAHAFDGCESLKTILFSDNLKNIEDYAFANCENLNGITLPETLEKMGNYSFMSCTSLTSIDIPDSVHIYGDAIFEYCSSLTNVSLSKKYDAITTAMFSNCTSLVNINIPDSVILIQGAAFFNCTSLMNITMSKNLVMIGFNAFGDCDNLSIVHIKDMAAWCNISFYHELSNPLYHEGSLYLNGVLVTDLVIPEGVESISNYAFRRFKNYTSITLPNTLTSIKEYSFYKNSNVTRINISNLDNWFKLFSEISNPFPYGDLYMNGKVIEEVVLPSTINKITAQTFSGLSSIKKLVIPSNISAINGSSLNELNKLESLTLPYLGALNDSSIDGTELSLLGYLFGTSWNSNMKSITQYYNVNYYKNFYVPASLKEVIITGGNIYYGAFSGCNMIERIVLPENITVIPSKAFSGCTNLKEIELPSSITTIKSSAFENCTSLESLVLSSNIETIEANAFKGCGNLKLYADLVVKPEEWNVENLNIYYKNQWAYDDLGKIYLLKYTITLDSKGVELDEYTIVAKFGEEVELPNLEKEGYAFLGWYLNGELFDSKNYIGTEDIILEARFKLNSTQNLKSYLEKINEINNYTITLKKDDETGYYGEFKFLYNAVYYSYGNTYDCIAVNNGYAENKNGIFNFTINSEGKVSFNGYLKDSYSNVIKGLYNTNEKIHQTSFAGDRNGNLCEGVPSLSKLDLSCFDYEMVKGESITIENPDSLRYLSYMLDEYFCSFFYSGISNAKVVLTQDDCLEITFSNKMKTNEITFIVSNIGFTYNDTIIKMTNSEDFNNFSVNYNDLNYGVNTISILEGQSITCTFNVITEGTYTITSSEENAFFFHENDVYGGTYGEIIFSIECAANDTIEFDVLTIDGKTDFITFNIVKGSSLKVGVNSISVGAWETAEEEFIAPEDGTYRFTPLDDNSIIGYSEDGCTTLFPNEDVEYFEKELKAGESFKILVSTANFKKGIVNFSIISN